MKKYWELFIAFARIGVMTFGGGYAMIPILERELIDKRGWTTNEELMDYYAVAQCTPGVIAVNTATFIGYKLYGVLGGIIATLGVIFPSLVIITAIAGVLTNFADVPAVKSAFAGIRVCVCVLIFNAVVKLWKKAVVDRATLVLFLAVFILSVFLDISPIAFVVLCAAAGIVFAVFGSGIALPDMGTVSSADFSSAAAYIYDRTEQSAADALREKAEKTLSELGIFDADISIDFDRSGAYPQVQSVKVGISGGFDTAKVASDLSSALGEKCDVYIKEG